MEPVQLSNVASHIVPGNTNVEYLDCRIVFEFVSDQTRNIFNLNKDVDVCSFEIFFW